MSNSHRIKLYERVMGDSLRCRTGYLKGFYAKKAALLREVVWFCTRKCGMSGVRSMSEKY